MKKFFLLPHIFIFLLFFQLALQAQNGGIANHWQFGDSAAINFNNLITPNVGLGAMRASEGCACVSETNGNLLFCTDGVKVFNKNNIQMPNGDSLWGNATSTQSAAIVPNPADSNQYYIFTIAPNALGGLAYSMVDMTFANGLGAVIFKNIPLITPTAEKLCIIRHCSGDAYWVIAHKWNSKDFYAYLVTAAGISPPVISHVGSFYQGWSALNPESIGHLKASPNGKRLAAAIYAIPNNNIEVFDFNDATGVISSPIYIPTSGDAYGLSFSPDNTKLYATFIDTNAGDLVQYDLNAANIGASATVLGTAVLFGALQLAPNHKMYVAIHDSRYLNVINNPNTTGLAADYQYNVIDLSPNWNSAVTQNCVFGLPNFPEHLFNDKSFLGNDVLLCGNSTTLNAGNSWAFYNWGTGDTTQMISVNQAGTYWVEVTDYCGNVFLDTINVLPTPIPLNLGNDTVICNSVNDSLVLNAGASGTAYLWSNGGTSAQITVYNSGTYFVQKTTYCGIERDTILVAFSSPISASLSADSILCNGNQSNIALSASGANNLFEYSGDNVTYQAANTFQLLAGNYTFYIRATNGCIDSLPSINLTEPPAISGNVNATPILCFGDSSVITVNPSGGVGNYQYALNNGVYQISPYFEMPTGTYNIVIQDSNACILHLAPLNIPTPFPLNGGLGNGTIDCYGNVNTLVAMIGGGTSPYQYSLNGGTYQAGNSFNVTAGTYTVTVQDSNLCEFVSNSVTLAPIAPITATATVTPILCPDDSATVNISATGGAGNLIYSLNGGFYQSSPTFVVAAGTYIVIVKDANGCTFIGNTLNISAPPPILPLIHVPPIPCHNQKTYISLGASGGTAPYKYALNNGNYQNVDTFFQISAGTYTLHIRDAHNCQKDTIIKIDNPLPISILAKDDTACYHKSTVINVLASGGTGQLQYSILGNPPQTNGTFQLVAGNYTIYVQDANACSATKNIKIKQYPDFQLAILRIDSAYCNLANGEAEVLASGGNGGFTYTWFINPIQYRAHLQKAEKGTYYVRVQDINGCAKDTFLTIPHILPPIAQYTSSPSPDFQPLVENDTIHFTAFTANAFSFSWDFGDGAFSSLENPVHAFYNAGNYPVTLTAYDIYKECPATYTLTYPISPYWAHFFIPNVFSPNNDTQFDTWNIETHDYDEAKVEVFDRWGTLVFETNDLVRQWNGLNLKGKQCEEGVYFYFVEIRNFKGEKRFFTGNVTLMR